MSADSRVPKKFSDLHLNVGDVLNVETLSNQTRYPVRLIGYVENRSLIVSAPKVKGKEFILPESQLLKVRLIANNHACGFQTKVLSTHRTPFIYSHLSYPDQFEAVAIRQASRVAMRIPVHITEAEQGSLFGDWPRDEVLVDVSHTGARVQTLKPLAAVGSNIKLTFPVVVDTVEKTVEVMGTVRNINEVNDVQQGLLYQYGVQFSHLDDVDHVYICGFVYEQMLSRDAPII